MRDIFCGLIFFRLSFVIIDFEVFKKNISKVSGQISTVLGDKKKMDQNWLFDECV